MEIKEKNKQKEQEKIKKKLKEIEEKKTQAKEQKEYEKDLLIACKNELASEFDKKIEEFGFDKKYELFSIMLRKELINKIAKKATERDYLENNYEKILNSTIKKYELNEKYKEEKAKEDLREYNEKMQPILEEEKRKEEKKEKTLFILFKIWGVIKWIFVGIFTIILLFLKSLSDLSKGK
jgi:hypothetical protein